MAYQAMLSHFVAVSDLSSPQLYTINSSVTRMQRRLEALGPYTDVGPVNVLKILYVRVYSVMLFLMPPDHLCQIEAHEIHRGKGRPSFTTALDTKQVTVRFDSTLKDLVEKLKDVSS
ncbi:hypothetical protein TNCV_1189071 [Trichonephila clavipes]|nr:hypothetical protein TNCV_1189071 [Trichonephila clavipes]